MRNEPLITVATITAAVTAVLALLVAFGLRVSDVQQSAILAVVAVVAPLIVAVAARPKVTPSALVVERVEDGTVVAGEGSELPTGQRVREYGSLEVTDIGGYDGVTDEPRRAAE